MQKCSYVATVLKHCGIETVSFVVCLALINLFNMEIKRANVQHLKTSRAKPFMYFFSITFSTVNHVIKTLDVTLDDTIACSLQH